MKRTFARGIVSIVVFAMLSCSTSTSSSDPETSSNANLKGITLSSGSLSPAFSPDITSYQVSLDDTEIVVTGVPADSNATVQGGGSIVLDMGENTVTLRVTAEDGTTTKDYVVSVYKSGWCKWVDTSLGASETDLTYEVEVDGSVTVTNESANLLWSRVSYQTLMSIGQEYKVSFTINPNRELDFLSVYENDNSQYIRTTVDAYTNTEITYYVTPTADCGEWGDISFRAYPDESTGYVDACEFTISNFTIQEN